MDKAKLAQDEASALIQQATTPQKIVLSLMASEREYATEDIASALTALGMPATVYNYTDVQIMMPGREIVVERPPAYPMY